MIGCDGDIPGGIIFRFGLISLQEASITQNLNHIHELLWSLLGESSVITA
jgi:hypothetical protein